MTRKQHFITILILGALSTISPFSIDMYLPAFPSIAENLHAPMAQIQLSLTSYFIGISSGQLLYGPLLDRFGRKLPLYFGLAVYVLASVGCVFVQNAEALIGLRFVQALGGCVSLVASRALVRDLFPVSETARVFSLLLLVLAVSPMLAPTVGGYVTAAFGWHTIIIILSAIGVFILLACVFYLPEGRKPDPSISLKPVPVLNNFFSVLKQPQFFTYALTSAIASSVIYAYIAGSPDVFMNVYRVNERVYGWIFALIAVAIIGSNQVNRMLLKRWKSEPLIVAGLLWQTAIGAVLVSGTIYNWFNLYTLIATLFLFMCGQGFTISNASALSLAPFGRLAGSASAMLGALQLGVGSIASALVSVFHNGTALPMIIAITACVVLSGVLLRVSLHFTRKEPDEEELEEESTRPVI
ncbi:MAG: multidrug effflux MFS transporter [Flavisolibacter sp.]|nr:multidrug effflux MFS transporter [Flavisolibacter sp.]